MRIKCSIIGLIVLTGVILTTCTYRANDPDICFTDDVLPIFIANCAGCHGTSGGYTFTSYEGIIKGVVKHHPLRSDVYKAIRGNSPKMPPESHKKLTSEQVNIIKAWISMGAPNSSNCGVCDTSTYTFSAIIQPIMNTWCVNCHSSTTPNGGYNFAGYSGVSVAAANGMLLGTIKHSPGYQPMPQGGAKISSCDIAKIENWVQAGYPNN